MCCGCDDHWHSFALNPVFHWQNYKVGVKQLPSQTSDFALVEMTPEDTAIRRITRCEHTALSMIVGNEENTDMTFVSQSVH